MLLKEFHRLPRAWRHVDRHHSAPRIGPLLQRASATILGSMRNQIGLKGSAKIFLDVEAAISACDNGQFCYDGYGSEGRWSFWGEACISKSYVERRWAEIFDVCDYIDDRNACPQNVIVARKRA